MIGNIIKNIFRVAIFIVKLFYQIIKLFYRAGRNIFKIIETKFSGLNLKIRYKLIILFLIVSLPAIIFTLISFGLVKETISNQIDAYQRSLVSSSVKAAQHYILTCQKPLTSMGDDRNFRETVRLSDRAQLSRILKRIYTKYKNFDFVGVVVRKGGRLVMESVYPSGKYSEILKDEKINEYMEYNFKLPKFRNSPVFYYRGEREVIITQPMKGAVLVGGVDIDKLSRLLIKTKPEPESEFIVFDENNNLIVGKEKEERFSPPDTEKTGRITFADSVIYYEPFPLIDGWLGLSTPENVIYRSLGYLTRLLIFFIVL